MIRARAVTINGAGGPEVLSLGALEVRAPGGGEVRVAVAAAGLNRTDCLQISRDVVPLFDHGALAPVVDAVSPMSEIATAHAQMESNQAFGKLALSG